MASLPCDLMSTPHYKDMGRATRGTDGMKNVLPTQPSSAQNEYDYYASSSGLVTALVGGVLAFGLVCLAIGGMFSNIDSRLLLTVTDTFSGLKDIRDVFSNTASYLATTNPPRIDHVPFPAAPETREDLEDLVRRGLMPSSALTNLQPYVWTVNSSLLQRVMSMSWCSSGRAIPNVLPAQRTPGCQCIADAYLDLVRSTVPAYVNSSTVVQVPVDVSTRVANRVYRCWDQRQVRRSRQCGDTCRVHLLGLPLFANIVLFLTCMSFLAFVELGNNGWNVYVIKLLIVAIGLVLCIPFFVRYIEANVLNICGVLVCLFYITVSLHSELNVNALGSNKVNALTLCFLVNLPLVLSAHTIQLGVSGYGRDLWAVLSFGSCGGLLGVLLQRYFWVCNLILPDPAVDGYAYAKAEYMMTFARVALSGAFVCVQVLFLLLFLAYRHSDSPYAGGSWLVQVAYQIFLSILAFLFQRDADDQKVLGTCTFLQSSAIIAVCLASVGMTIIATVDVAAHPG